MWSDIKTALRAPVGILAIAALATGGCSGVPSYEALFDTSPEAEGTGIVGAGLVRAVVIIAKYQATQRQREVVEQRARLAHAKLLASQRRSVSGQTSAVRKKTTSKKVTRYIAVDTEKDSRSKGRKSVMIWDTQSQEIVGNNVYDVEAPPRVLDTGRFEIYSAQYVASADF